MNSVNEHIQYYDGIKPGILPEGFAEFAIEDLIVHASPEAVSEATKRHLEIQRLADNKEGTISEKRKKFALAGILMGMLADWTPPEPSTK